MSLCQQCDHPLAESATLPALPHEVMAANELGSVIAEATAGRLATTAATMKSALFRWAEEQGAVSVKTKARLLGMPQSLVCYWTYMENQPSLQRLWELGLRNGLCLLDICRGSIGVSAPTNPSGDSPRAWKYRRLTSSQKKRLLADLALIAARDCPPCVIHAAQELGVAAGTLTSLAPDLCKKLDRLHRGGRQLTSAVRFIHFKQKVTCCVNAHIDVGKVPTMRDISLVFKKPGILRSPKSREFARAEIERAKLELLGDSIDSSAAREDPVS
jgi:hypothetical protein